MKIFSRVTILCVAGFATAAQAILSNPAALQTPEVTIEGRLITDQDVPLPRVAISFQQTGLPVQLAWIERNGSFRLKLLPGDYAVALGSLPANYVVRSLRQGSVDLQTNPLKAAGVLQELQIVVGLNVPVTWVRVSGRVSGSDVLPTFGTNSVMLERGGDFLPLKAPIRMDGRFEFERVLPGTYTARVVDAGESAIAGIPAVPVQASAGSDITGLVFAVQTLVPVTVRIEVEEQAPPPYLSLSFTRDDGRFFSSDIGNQAGILKAQVLPGEYRVRVLTASAGYSVTGISKGAVDVLAEPLRVEPATPLELTVRVRTSTKPVRVSGRVVRPSDTDPAAGRVTLYTPLDSISINSGVLSPRAVTTVVRPDGSFEFSSVLPGAYRLAVEAAEAGRGDVRTEMLFEPQPVLVGDNGATGIEVRVPRHLELKGRFVVEDGGPMPRPSIDTEFVTSVPNLSPRLVGLFANSDGAFRTVLPEGEYRFSVSNLPPGYFVKSIPQTFRLSAETRDFVVVLGASAPTRRVRGRVIDAPNPASTSSISIVLRTGITEIETTVGPGGRFEFSKVPPGAYTVGVDSTSGSTSPARVAIGEAPPGEPRIVVADKDIEDLRVTGNTALTAFVGRGRVVTEGGGPMPRFSLTFNGGGGSLDPSPVNGTFQAWMPIGSSKVVVSDVPKEYALKALTYGATNLLETELVLRASDVNSDLLRIVLMPSGIPWKKVAGRLTGIEGIRREQLRLSLVSLHQNVDTLVAPDGSFEFPQVLSGTYRASLQLGTSGARVGLDAEIVVGDENISLLVLSAPRTVTINIVTEGAAPADPLHLGVMRRDAENRFLDYQPVAGTAIRSVTAGDRLEIRRVPFGYRVKAVSLGSIDLLKDVIRFDEASSSSISIVLESAPVDPLQPEFTLRGRVQSATNPARKRVTATYVKRVHEAVMYTMMETFVRDDGSFQFERLPSGPYEIRIVDQTEVSRFVLPDDTGNGVLLSIP